MIVNENFRVKAPIEEVWQFMLDPEKIGPCIPGCEKIEVVGENTYESTIKMNFPIISITAKSRTTIVEITPPHHVKSVTEGQYDIGSGRFHQDSVIDLKAISDHEVEVSYSADTTLEGGFASLSEAVMSAMAKGLGAQFAKNIQSKLEGHT
jgi:carbon monoxide dehydrogenase subunit G